MAKFDLREYARQGADARARELNEELEAIYGAFPELRRRGARPQGPGGGSEVGNGRSHARTNGRSETSKARRTRPKMSAAQRKAVGERMKKYWAARRKEQASKSK